MRSGPEVMLRAEGMAALPSSVQMESSQSVDNASDQKTACGGGAERQTAVE